MHFVRECPFTKQLCKSCGKTGHKEGYCNCLSAKQHSKKKSIDGKFAGNHISSGLRRNFIDVSVNDGSRYTAAIRHRFRYNRHFKANMEEAGISTSTTNSQKAKPASGKPLQFVGEIQCNVTMGNQTKFGTCYVTNQPSLNLFGLDWIELFGLWSLPLSLICHIVQEDHSKPIQQYKKEFPRVFANSLGHCTKTRVKLFLKSDERPGFKSKRPVPFMSIPKVEEELDRLENLGIISPVDFSPWAAPIVVVKKAAGKVRFCADYSTGLNAALEPHNYPLPVPDDILTKLNGSKVFSIIDLSDAYLQVEVDDESKKLLTINPHRGLYRFNRLAPGVKSAPGAFQQLMNGMIANLEAVETFLDDIIIFSKTESDHHKRLRALFNRLCEYGFRSS
ncbi:uncharacterized protein K02A2.6-like [Uranotaenia lowii]|uniref:uncharacterized protein K02A2.6-like n=1 Tax=Uranotaenia lowii TaxID=190385 RepID=UPI0024791C3D|nr:uncharacterized protein K02A2.6-like [Uranotaenia lowii]